MQGVSGIIITKKEWVLDGATVIYGSATELRATLDYDFSEEKKFSYRNLSMDEIIRHLALFISRLWQIHVFGGGNIRTTAVFFIKYLRTLGFDVTNDIFAENAWYFRNALVRANYNDLKNGIHETTEYLELFIRNLLLNEHHPLHNRTLHISGTFKGIEKPDIEMTKPDIEGRKADIEKLFQSKTESHILKLREAFPCGAIFGRSDVMEIIDIKPSRASELLKKMSEYGIIEPVSGYGKEKYRFRKEQGRGDEKINIAFLTDHANVFCSRSEVNIPFLEKNSPGAKDRAHASGKMKLVSYFLRTALLTARTAPNRTAAQGQMIQVRCQSMV